MNSAEQPQQARPLTSAELAFLIKLFREAHQWSQEQLAAIAGLNVRTIQRAEKGEPASLDTRRALARAFEFEDIDLLSKPLNIPTEEEMKAAKEKFDRENVLLTAIPLTTGKDLAKLAESCMADLSEPAFELSREADEAFAILIDYFRDYRDCHDAYSLSQKFDVYDEMQVQIDMLRKLGVSLRYAIRDMQLKMGSDPNIKPMPATVAYLVAFPVGEEPDQFATPKSGSMRM